MKNIDKFRQLTIDRRLAIKNGRTLKNFIVKKKILLGKDGKIYKINRNLIKFMINEPVMEMPSDFINENSIGISEITLPVYEYCHICGKEFTFRDVFTGNIINGKMHDDCKFLKK